MCSEKWHQTISLALILFSNYYAFFQTASGQNSSGEGLLVHEQFGRPEDKLTLPCSAFWGK
uniref:Uncharacterized protein n=1 Tax=Anguilla anguilla TaxID=7936 RepID=A0A0E9UZS2_ANGAN